MQVMLIGPDPSMKGGVSHGIRLLLKHPPPEVRYISISTVTPAVEAATLRRGSLRYILKSFANLRYFLHALAQIERVIDREKPELAHIRFSSYGSSFRKGVVARRLHQRGMPFILSAHGSEYRRFFAALPKPVQQWVRRMFLLSRGVIALSESWRQYYESIIADSRVTVWVLPNAVELPQGPLVWSVEEPTCVLFLGRLGERKGSDRLLHAIAALPPATRSKVTLRMAGDGAVEQMRALASSLGIESQVEIRPWIEGEQKLQWLQETNVFALPSRDEGLPNAMLEAMAWGKALIVSPAGAIPEFVDNGIEGFIVPADAVEAISSAIQRLVDDPALRVRMGQAARQRVEPLDIQRYRVQLGHIYQQALQVEAPAR